MSDRVHREDDDPIDLVWENTIILQAPDRDAAYEKAFDKENFKKQMAPPPPAAPAATGATPR